jgi:hypothetical protein
MIVVVLVLSTQAESGRCLVSLSCESVELRHDEIRPSICFSFTRTFHIDILSNSS